MLETWHGQRDLGQDGTASRVDDRDRIVGRVGDIHTLAPGDERTGTGTADSGDVVAIHAHEITGLDALNNCAGREIDAEDRHGVRMVRTPEARHSDATRDAADHDALFGFLRGHTIRRKRQASLGARLARDTGNQRILEHADVGDPRDPFVRRHAHRKRIAPDANRLHDLPRLDVDSDQPVVELIDDEEPAAIAAESEISREAVVESVRVQVDGADHRRRGDIEHEDSSFVGAAVVERCTIRREGSTHVRPGPTLLGPGADRGHAPHGVRRVEIDELERVPAHDCRARSIRSERQRPCVRPRPQHTAGRCHAPAVYKNCGVALDAGLRIAAWRFQRWDGRDATGSTGHGRGTGGSACEQFPDRIKRALGEQRRRVTCAR